MVIDTTTGQTPPTAAERMDLHDRAMGVEPNRPVRPAPAPSPAAPPAARATQAQPKPARPAPTDPGKTRMAAKVAEMQNRPIANRPWTEAKAERPATRPEPAPARIPERPAPLARGRKTIVTGKWWDSKGPRTIELGPKGQQTLSGGFVTLFFVALIAAIVVMFIEPIILFVGAFLLFRFGGNILGPIGAGIVDKAVAERN